MTTPLLTGTLPGVPGDVPASVRLVVTDRAGQSRRYADFGIQQRYYLGLSLLFDSSSLTTTGFAGSSTTRSGSYGANVVRATLTTQPTAVAGLLNQGHVGTFRVRLRVWATGLDVRVRLSWADGSGVYRANEWAAPPVEDAFSDFDLGTITITPALAGTQSWSGRIEALSATTGDTVDLDATVLMPAGEGYGKLRGAFTYTPGAIVGRDDFNSITAGTALNGRTASAGGTWATSGATTDFAAADAPLSTDETMSRSTTATEATPRFAILGSATPTDVEAGVSFYFTNTNAQSYAGVIARWVDANNYLYLETAGNRLNIGTLVAGVRTDLVFHYNVATEINPTTWYGLRLVAYASGRILASLLSSGGATLLSFSLTSTAVATGGALASGKSGYHDQIQSAVSVGARYYDNFYTATPAPEPTVLYSGRQAQIRSDGAIRQDSTGTYYGPWTVYGSYPKIPPAGAENRTTRIAVRAKRNDIETDADANIADALQVQALITPRYLAPR